MNRVAMDGSEVGTPQTEARPRLAIVISHPIQHFCPMYRSIAADGRVELLVVFAESGAAPRFDDGFGRVVSWQENILEGYRSVVVTAEKEKRAAAVLEELRRFAPDVVYVHGYALDYLRQSIKWARKQGVPVMMTTDSELLHPRPWYVRAMKRLALPRVLRDVDLFLTVGDENERYFEHYGVGRDRFLRDSFSIDSACYDKTLAKRDEVRSGVRERLDIPADTVAFLTVGKMIARKGQADLVLAFGEAMRTGRRAGVLLIAGDGEERARLEELARPLGAAVKLLGFIGVEELPAYYAGSDVYVHPSSHDPHPLSISEALYCGLPVVSSDSVGSVGPTDDVQVGKNGWVYETGDVPALAAVLGRLMDSSEERESAAKESRSLGLLHSADYCAGRFIDGALLVLARRRQN